MKKLKSILEGTALFFLGSPADPGEALARLKPALLVIGFYLFGSGIATISVPNAEYSLFGDWGGTSLIVQAIIGSVKLGLGSLILGCYFSGK